MKDEVLVGLCYYYTASKPVTQYAIPRCPPQQTKEAQVGNPVAAVTRLAECRTIIRRASKLRMRNFVPF